ncbi:hypothetical protein CW703_05095 [Candidatus Bathyarchaeota archaeon]|nr:MAG: hypothetical protein CW703_05095 [Candidatus Bathyarchaeota archaeon]
MVKIKKREEKIGEEKALYTQKIRKAAKILLFKKHRRVGVKGWELKKALGKNYLKIVGMLNHELEKIGLEVKIVSEGEEFEKAWFFVTLAGTPTLSEAETSGWRIDDLAVLAVTIAYLNIKQGSISRSEIEKILRKKFPEWKVGYNLNRFIRMGYLTQDENEILRLGWRAKAEVDQKTLLELILAEK